MIHYITTRSHAYAFAHIERKLGRGCVRRTSYDRLFARSSFKPGTYIFTDIDRLEDWEIRLAAEVYRHLNAHAPCTRAMNDPARVKCRYALLRTLYEVGLNRFNVYRGDEARQPVSFPVFLREQSHHGYPLTDLLNSQVELDAALEDVTGRGIPLGSVLVIEYAGQPVRENVFCRYEAFRVGNAIVPHHVVFKNKWLVKYGHGQIIDEEDRRTEEQYIRTNPHRDLLMRVFDLANIEYGRADYGMIDGAVQIYEINTNPKISYDIAPLTALQKEAYAVAEALLLEALSALGRATSRKGVSLDSPKLSEARRNLQFLYSRRWRP